MNFDEYGEVINGEETYKSIAEECYTTQPILIGWTDEMFTHYDILFTYTAMPVGTNIQGGVKGTDLFVSIMRKSAFSFKLENQEKSVDYIAEKLNLSINETAKKLTELINGIIRELNFLRGDIK